MRLVDPHEMRRTGLRTMAGRRAGGSGPALASAQQIIEEVVRGGDRALKEFTRRFDGVDLPELRVSAREFDEAEEQVPAGLRQAIALASGNIEAFHRPQVPQPIEVETRPGILCRREWRAIDPVGLYVPGGTAPLISTVLMLGIPARLAGCREIILCTPPSRTGSIAPAILFAARSVGIRTVFKAGGAQAIAAMAAGTGSVPAVRKIFGPGNRFVAAAKSIVSKEPYNVAVDLVAGPTELMVIADGSADARLVASDLVSQAEHGEDSEVVLVTTSAPFAEAVERECREQLISLPRAQVAAKVIERAPVLVVGNLDEAFEAANLYAPEHLSLAVVQAGSFIGRISNAGSVFIGPMSAVAFGDYASGTNHTLPTAGTARSAGGVTVESFLKPVFFQTIDREGAAILGPAVRALAIAEGLDGHARAAEYREKNDD